MIPKPRPRPPAGIGIIPKGNPTKGWSLGHAQEWLRKRIHDGEHCPCCGQFSKIYRRRIHTTIARSLIAVYRLADQANDGWVHVPSEISPACEVGKARYWGLIEEATEPRPDGGRAGYWRLTDYGRDFVLGRVGIRRVALIYDGRCLGFDGEFVHIGEALGHKFDYAELMSGV